MSVALHLPRGTYFWRHPHEDFRAELRLLSSLFRFIESLAESAKIFVCTLVNHGLQGTAAIRTAFSDHHYTVWGCRMGNWLLSAGFSRGISGLGRGSSDFHNCKYIKERMCVCELEYDENIRDSFSLGEFEVGGCVLLLVLTIRPRHEKPWNVFVSPLINTS